MDAKIPVILKKVWQGETGVTLFRDRYGLSMRLPEKLSVNRAAATNKKAIEEFYSTLDATLKKYNLER